MEQTTLIDLEKIRGLQSPAKDIDGFIKGISTVSDFATMKGTPKKIHVSGYHAKGDGAYGSHFFKLKDDVVPDGTYGNAGTVWESPEGVYELQFEGYIKPEWFGLNSLVYTGNFPFKSNIFKEYTKLGSNGKLTVEAQKELFFDDSINYVPELGSGTTYYFSVTDGDDANDGLSPTTPLKSIDKIGNSITVQPGDNFLFKRGDVFERKRVRAYSPFVGTEKDRIMFSSYGDHNLPKPKFQAIQDRINHTDFPAVDLSLTWTLTDGETKIWETPGYSSLRVWINNVEKINARYYSDLSYLQPYFRDTTNNKTYYYGDEDPNTLLFSWEYKGAFYVPNCEYLTFYDLDIEGTQLSIKRNKGSIVVHNVIGKNATAGVENYGSSDVVNNDTIIENNIIDSGYTLSLEQVDFSKDQRDGYSATSDGVFVTGKVKNLRVRNNYIKNWGHSSLNLNHTAKDGFVINSIISHNVMTSPDISYGGRLGYSGANTKNNLIEYNLVVDVSIRSQIGGHENVFRNNVIDGVKNSPVKLYTGGEGFTIVSYNGDIYDNNIYNNLIMNTESYGIWAQGTVYNNKIRNNIFYNCGTNVGNISIRDDEGNGIAGMTNIYKDNIFFNDNNPVVVIRQYSKYNDEIDNVDLPYFINNISIDPKLHKDGSYIYTSKLSNLIGYQK